MKPIEFGKLVLFVIFCEAAGAIGSLFTMPAITGWYAGISKPWFNPPNWVFAPAWAILFALMGAALFLVWQKGLRKKEAKLAVAAFAGQFALNIAWSFLFFGLQNPFLAFVEIILLWLAIAATIFFFSRVSRKAALLLLPYIAWVSFAALLNYGVWMLNA